MLELGSGGTVGRAACDTFASVENVQRSGFDDTITGKSAANVLRGYFGNGVPNGRSGNDTT